jgi:hypothetical protein
MNEQQEFSVTFKVAVTPGTELVPEWWVAEGYLTEEIRGRVINMVAGEIRAITDIVAFDPTTVEVTPTNTIAPISTSVRESAAPVFVEPAAPTTSPRKSWLRRAVRQG